MFEALIIVGRETRRVTPKVDNEQTLLDRALELAGMTDPAWDVVIVGDYVPELEVAARRSLSGANSVVWQLGLTLIGGARGTGLSALVRELGAAANRAARFSRTTRTAFVFKDAALETALTSVLASGSRVVERNERDGLVAVLVWPGWDYPWSRRD